MLDAQAARVLPAVGAALAEDGLGAGVVPVHVEAEVVVADAVRPAHAPAREGPRLLAHVVLRVAPSGAEGEELHELARVVLVRRPLRVLDPVQPDEHGRVPGDPEQQRLEGAERVRAQEVVLGEHELLRPHAGVRGGEPVVPDERHPLDELPVRAHHAVEPPEVVVAPGVARRERGAVVVGRGRPVQACLRRIEEVVDGLFQALLGDLRGLPGLRPESGAPEQALGFAPAKRTAVDGHTAGHGSQYRDASRLRRPLFV